MEAASTLARLEDVLVLRTVEGRPQGKTAAILAVSEKTVETRLYRAPPNWWKI